MLEKYAGTVSRRLAGVTPEAMSRLCACNFPGKVRELEIEARRFVALAEDGEFITVHHLPPEIAKLVPPVARGQDASAVLPGRTLKEKLEALEEKPVRDTLDRCAWNHSRAARELGLSRVGLANKIKRYAIERASMMA